jgi:multiple sugar transport system ATP-binding protein
MKEFSSGRRNIAAVKDIDFEIADREFFVLLGPSGCGKSTILNLIAGLEKPTGGEIWFDDKPAAVPEKRIFLSPKERDVAMVFQSYALYPHLKVFDNIAFPLRIMKQDKKSIKQSVEGVAEMLELSSLLHARPGELSGGQRQRVAIARAIVRQPSLFLLDEPLSNLDALLRASTRTELKNLQRRLGITTVYVTHDQVEAMSLGDRVALLRAGQLEQIGAPEKLYEKPANAFVARFIGSPPMNLLRAALVEEGDGLWVQIEGARCKIPEARAGALGASRSREVLLGVRPEHIHLGTKGAYGFLQGTVSRIEQLGRETLVHANIGNQDVLLLTDDKKVVQARSGERVSLGFDLEQAHFFAPDDRQELISVQEDAASGSR